MARGGLVSYRTNLSWGVVERRPGVREWTAYDALVGDAARAGITVVPVLLGSPAFAAARPQHPPRPRWRAAFRSFVREAVERYGRHGTFWAAHRELPNRPATSWQVWNEPNFRSYWPTRPDPRGYVRLLRPTARVIRAADPRARVVLAGLPESALGMPMRRFLAAVYRARGAKAAFDAVAIHPYAADKRGVMGAVRRARSVMRRARDGRTPLWVTEVGWATGGPVTRRTRAFKTTERGQATKLRQALTALHRARRRNRIGLVSWFAWRDRRPIGAERDWWALHTGLRRIDGSPKPAWHELRRLIAPR
jgi:polysaccharide biosynthesis protein PslG